VSLQAWARFVLVLALAAVVQVAVLNSVVIGGAHPDVFLLVAVVAGLIRGPQYGATMAFVTGLVADLFLPTPYGLSSLCFVLIAFGVGLTAGLPGARTPYGFRVVTAVLGSLGGTLLFAGVETLIGQPHPDIRQLAMICLVVSLGSAVLVVPTFSLVRRAVTIGPAAQRESASMAGGSSVR
jgi:rod shape-determining protein MreD